MKTLAVFGGTFNPLHKGHEQMLTAIVGLKWIDEVLLIPSKIPPHKEVDFLASDRDRLNMCSLIAEKYPKVSVSDIELLREGKSYTVDTLRILGQQYRDHKLYLAVGGDMITSFTSWKDHTAILDMADIIAFKRVETDDADFDDCIKDLRNIGARITVMENDIMDISSTVIRNNIGNKDILKKHLPENILNYIIDNKVYGD